MLFLMAKIRKTAQIWFLFNMYNTHEWCYRYAFITIMAHEMMMRFIVVYVECEVYTWSSFGVARDSGIGPHV